jgi:hypothetical protein
MTMATFEKCDGGCGKISPDEDGLYHANHWVEVAVRDRSGRWRNSFKADSRKYLLCRECAEAMLREIQVEGRLLRAALNQEEEG